MPSNSAAWIPNPKQRLQVKEAPYPKPKPDEVVIKNHAIGINPIDWILQDQGNRMMFQWIKFPFVLGSDVAGEVVEVGSKVQRFKIGDRVVGHALSTDEKVNTPAHGAFQLYTVLLERTTAQIPEGLSFESASVLPLGLATAAGGLFEKDQLALQFPQLNAKPTGKTVLIWGGSTSVGCNAIQLSVAAGYEVFSTSSPKNFELLKSLGASQVFDYRDPSVVSKIVQAMNGRTGAGALAIGENSSFLCLDVLSRCKGDKHIALATFPGPDFTKLKRFVAIQTVFYFLTSIISLTIKSRLRGIKTSFIWGSSLAHSPVGDAIYVNFLPEALAQGKFKAMPESMVVGEGLEAIQAALEAQKKGVSAKKIVVTLR